jgi:DNA-binding Xre family transcriptional regulator
MPRKKLKVIDNTGNEIPCVTLREAAARLDMTSAELKLVMFKAGDLPYYRVMGKGKRRLIRIKTADLDQYKKDRYFYDKIAEKIIEARKQAPVIKKGMKQNELAKEAKLSLGKMNRIERKKERVGIKTLERIANALGKKLDWFLE